MRRYPARPLNLNRRCHRNLCPRLAELTADIRHLADGLAPVHDVQSLDDAGELLARAAERLATFGLELK